jgi:putative transposase
MYVYKELTRNTRLRGYDYARSGAYFVTICTHAFAPSLGTIKGSVVRLTPSGEIVRRTWFELPSRFPRVQLDAFVIMPDHVHGIMALHKPGESRLAATTHSVHFSSSLSEIVRVFKSLSAFRINRLLGAKGSIWQRSYYDRVVRSGDALDKIRRYVYENPLRWSFESGVSRSKLATKDSL